MTDKVQLIKQEIEKRINISTEQGYTYSAAQLKRVIDFIDSIPEEHNEDLEKEISKWRNHYISVLDNNLRIDLRDIEITANHFAEWQKNKDLEDSIKSDMTMPNKFYEKGKADAMKEMKETLQTEYEKGRFDMQQEMMKDAVDATIFSELKGSDGSVFQAKSDRFKMDGAKIGDRIKVIPIKTEQQ